MNRITVAVAGANGYVGRHLIEALLLNNVALSALVRKKDPHTEFVGARYYVGDCESGEGLDAFLRDAKIAYYLVHSLDRDDKVQEREARCAQNFAEAAKRAHVQRVIYLSGLGDSLQELSEHLTSRHAVGDIFRKTIDEVVEFRASAIFGAGSVSYEMISFLVERLPIMILPKWVFNKTQPVSIKDAIFYLIKAADLDRMFPRIIEIGGADVISYKDMMMAYAKQRGLKRLIIRVPFLSLHLSSLWLHVFTPLQARVGRNIIESLKNDTVVQNPAYLDLFHHRPSGLKKMIREALDDETREILSPQKEHLWRFDKAKRIFGYRFGRYIIKRDDISINARPETIFATIANIGGSNGWYYMTFLWRVRAFFDRLVGGPGFSHGKSMMPLEKGAFIDCWLVESIQPEERLLLDSLMKMPGDAHLEFEIIKVDNASLLYQTAFFRPKGLFGSFYWYLLYAPHMILFEGLLKAIKKRSEDKA